MSRPPDTTPVTSREVLDAALEQARAADELALMQEHHRQHPTGYSQRDVKRALKRMSAACDATVLAARRWRSP